jgi:multidrug efflux pump subunit AcrA (membrane-fusion protein)
LFICSCLVLLLAACKGATTPTLSQGSAASVTRGKLSTMVRMSGQVSAQNARQLTFGTVSGRVIQILVKVGQRVAAGDPLVKLETTSQERKVREAQASLQVAEASLAAAQSAAGESEIAVAKANVSAAEYALAAAQQKAKLAEEAGLRPLEEAVADAQTALRDAQDALKLSETQYNLSKIRKAEYDQDFFTRKLRDATTDEARAEAQTALSKAISDLADAHISRERTLSAARDKVAEKQAALNKASSVLALARAQGNAEIKSAQLAVEQAAVKVQEAKSELEDLQAGKDSKTVKSAKTVYEAALAKLESAQSALAAMTLTAPFEGVVLTLYTTVGAQVGASTRILYIADTRNLIVSAQTTETDIAKLSVGQKVGVFFDGYPNHTFQGAVTMLPARGAESGGITVYTVEMSLDAQGANILPGTLADVRIYTGEETEALLVPLAAVWYLSSNQMVVTVKDASGQPRVAPVTIGANDGIMAEVKSGLLEGDQVILPLVAPVTPTSAPQNQQQMREQMIQQFQPGGQIIIQPGQGGQGGQIIVPGGQGGQGQGGR